MRSDCVEPNLPMADLCSVPVNCSNSETVTGRRNVFCNDIRSMRFYLHLFSARQKHLGRFCLAYALTYRVMTDFQGIAWIKVVTSCDSVSLVSNYDLNSSTGIRP